MNRTKITKIVMRWLKTARPDNSDAPSDLVDAICSEVAKMNPAWEVDKNALKRVILRVKINRTLVPFLVTKEGSEYLEEIADTLISNPSAWMKRKDSDDKEKS